MIEKKVRTVYFYKNYFSDFLKRQPKKVVDKIIWTLRLIETQRYIPEEYLKHITNTEGLYEIRVNQSGDIYRIFCFFDKSNLIILTNGFQKKT